MERIKILWVDDEIEMLKPHFLFLDDRGYTTTPCTNGQDALDLIEAHPYDVILLDENMPGLNGLETLVEIKNKKPNLPVVMITKNEEEQIMEEAIGSKISDYLIKPVNPHQILLSLKKILNQKNLVAEKTTQSYQQEFGKIAQTLMDLESFDDWIEYFKKLMYWELELETLEDNSFFDIFETQKKEANAQFAKFIKSNYPKWMQGDPGPTLSHTVFQKYVVPEIKETQPTLLVLIDNLRFDQWKTIVPELVSNFTIEQEHTYFSILPTATQYARNSFFSGLTPLEIERRFPQWWKSDTDEGGKNLYEKELLEAQWERSNFKRPISYHKITQLQHSQQLIKNLQNHTHEGLTTVVYNFVDMISHAKTEMEVIKELAGDDKAYRSLTASWFKNSPLFEIIQKAQELGQKLIITTDHGTINCKHPTKVIGNKNISSNLRYKTGKNLSYNDKDVFAVKNPKDIFLPSISFNSPFIFAKENLFFAYPNNYNHFVNYYKNTYQHGGVSLEEMIIPFAVYHPK